MPQPGEQPKTVLFIIARLARGGAEMVLLELVRRMDQRVWHPVVVSLGPPDVLSAQFVDAGADVRHLGLRRAVGTPIALVRLRRLVGSIAPDVVHGVMFYGDICGRFLRLSGVRAPTVGAIHSTFVGPPLFRRMLRWTDALVDCVTAVSELVAQEHIRLGTVGKDKVRVVHNGVDEDRLRFGAEPAVQALREQLQLRPEQRVVLSVGRLETEKNYSLLLRAFATLCRHDPTYRLVIVGDGSLRTRLAHEAVELGIDDSVRFPGMLDPVAPAYQLADVFVLSSDIEGLPLVVLEAMAAGVPMVLTSVGGIPGVVEHGVTGWLVPPGDSAALVDGIRHMLSLPDTERARFVFDARAVFRKRFSVEQMTRETVALYDELVAPSGAPG